ncbi:MAG TPA: hypothetical protein VIE89_22210 [Candidatus Binatia bacterium]
MESFVMPACMPGIQTRRMRPRDIHVAWIPALHAGVTELRNHAETGLIRLPILSRPHTRGTELAWII